MVGCGPLGGNARMKNKVITAMFIGLLLVGLIVAFSQRPHADPKDLSHWIRVASAADWSAEAAQNKPEAQFYRGLILVRTNVITMIDRVPGLCAIPFIGRRFFEKISYGIDDNIGFEQLAEAHRWIKKSADQGFAPAKEAEKLFIGKEAMPNQTAEAGGSSERPAKGD